MSCKILLSKNLSVCGNVIYPALFWGGNFDLNLGSWIYVIDLKVKWPGLKYVEVLGKQNIFAVLQDRLFFFSLFDGEWLICNSTEKGNGKGDSHWVAQTQSFGQWISQTSRTIHAARASCSDVKHPSMEFTNLYFRAVVIEHTHCSMSLLHHTSWELGWGIGTMWRQIYGISEEKITYGEGNTVGDWKLLFCHSSVQQV